VLGLLRGGLVVVELRDDVLPVISEPRQVGDVVAELAPLATVLVLCLLEEPHGALSSPLPLNANRVISILEGCSELLSCRSSNLD